MRFRTINYLLVAIIVILGLSSSMITVHAVTYSPAVTAGQWAKYETLYDICKPASSPSCQAPGGGNLNDTAYGLIQIIRVSGTIVTFDLFTQYKNGTTSTMPAQVDVSSGVANVTSFGNGGPSDYFILAGSLAAPDPIWSSTGAPTLNLTSPVQFLGKSRTLNFLNHTSTLSVPGFSYSTSTAFVFDQQSGLFVEFSFNITTTGPYGDSETAFALGMTDNNIWRSSTLPDFSIGPIGSMEFATGSSGSTTVTITGDTGFTSKVVLSINSPSGISCSLGTASIQGSGSSTLTCNGLPGTYTVTITGSTGYSSHSAQVTATIDPTITFAPDFSIGAIPSITAQSGSSGTATVTFTAQNGFSSDIALTLVVPSGLTCTLDHNVIHGSGTAKLTCNGQPGTYTVKVDAASGSTSHSAQTNVTVNSAPVSNQPPTGFPLAYIYAGVAVAIAAAVAGTVFFVRRKPSSPQKPTL